MPDIDWHIGEGAERETIAKSNEPRRSRRGWIAVLIVAILGAALGAWYRSLPEATPQPTPTSSPTPHPPPARPAIPAKLFDTIDREAQALADGDVETYLALLAPENNRWVEQQRNSFYAWGRPADDNSLYTIVDFNLSTPTKAWADIRQFRNGHWFRETRFYQWEDDRWLRSDSNFFFWSGQTETLDTPHFHTIYAVEDRDLVRPIVRQLEEAYPQVCRDLGCVETTAEFTYTLKFSGTSSDGLWLSADTRELHFSSPRVTGVFEDSLLDSSGAFWFITIAAVQRAYYDAATQWNGDADGHIVFNAIISWANQRLRSEPAFDLQAFVGFLATQTLVPLEDLWGPAHDFDETMQKEVPRTISSIAYDEAFAVIHFIAQEYGAQSMPKILKALGTAQSFADVVETGLGVPLDEFDQKWQAWLKQDLESPR